jgi:hypothetical protein
MGMPMSARARGTNLPHRPAVGVSGFWGEAVMVIPRSKRRD